MTNDNRDAGELTAHTVRARRFEVIDNEGAPRAKLYTADDGTPVVCLYDSDLKPRISLTLDDSDSPGISLFAGAGTPTIEVRIEQGIPEFRLYGLDRRLRVAIYVQDDRPAMSYFDNEERLRLSVYLEENGDPSVVFYDQNEKIMTHLTQPAD